MMIQSPMLTRVVLSLVLILGGAAATTTATTTTTTTTTTTPSSRPAGWGSVAVTLPARDLSETQQAAVVRVIEQSTALARPWRDAVLGMPPYDLTVVPMGNFVRRAAQALGLDTARATSNTTFACATMARVAVSDPYLAAFRAGGDMTYASSLARCLTLVGGSGAPPLTRAALRDLRFAEQLTLLMPLKPS